MPRSPTTTADQPPVIRPTVRGDSLDLQCPECTETIAVPRGQLVAGAAVHCGHCGSEPELAQEFDDATGKTGWILIDPLTDYDDEHG